MGCLRTIRNSFVYVFEYDTPTFLAINSIKVGIIYRTFQLIILAYIIGWVLVYKKGYQEQDNVVSAVVTKVKGISLTNETGLGRRIWDVVEYVNPAEEKDALFVATNALFTFRQSEGNCPEDPDVAGAICKIDADCVPITGINLGNGVRTGRCVNTTDLATNASVRTCEIFAWCPVERETSQHKKKPLLNSVPNFTILIKNSVAFPKFKVKRFNIPDIPNIQSCVYDPVTDPLCPVFQIGTILNLTDSTYDEIGSQGGIISIEIKWDCDLDLNVNKCIPAYKFTRLDAQQVVFGKGWNFRYTNHYWETETNGTKVEYRDLIKLYGIRFIIIVDGQAGKFNMIPFTMNVGSGIALFGIATVLCDFFVLYVLKKRAHYRDAKYKMVEGDDAYKVMEESMQSQ